jgi:hypothetical protein
VGVDVGELEPVAVPNVAATRKSIAPLWFCGHDRTARNHPGAKEIGTPTDRPLIEVGVTPLAARVADTALKSWS